MTHLKLISPEGIIIRFELNQKQAPKTCKAFVNALPFEGFAVQARWAGAEIWIKDGPKLDVPEENATMDIKSGELGYVSPAVDKTVGKSIAICYGDAKLAGEANIFAKVTAKDWPNLEKLGKQIWLKGAKNLSFII